jgi:hypothetical protein
MFTVTINMKVKVTIVLFGSLRVEALHLAIANCEAGVDRDW